MKKFLLLCLLTSGLAGIFPIVIHSEPSSGLSESKSVSLPRLISPAEESVLYGTTVTFEWEPGANGAAYWLFVGKSLGGKEIYSEPQEGLKFAVSGLPDTGQPIYVRLWTNIKDQWYYQDYIYKSMESGLQAATMISPANGSLLGGSVEFEWNRGRGVSEYWLYLGTDRGRRNIYNKNLQAKTSITIDNLPQDGLLLYARLWSKINNNWRYEDYVYSTGQSGIPFSESNTASGLLIQPVPGSVFKNRAIIFRWQSVPSVSRYVLEVGTKKGAKDILRYVGKSTSTIAKNVDLNVPAIYVRLKVKTDEGWQQEEYIFKTPKLDKRIARLTGPARGALLRGSKAVFAWDVYPGIEEVGLSVGTALGKEDVFSEEKLKGRFISIEGIPQNGKAVFVRLKSKIDGYWFYEDYTYGTRKNILVAARLKDPVPGTVIKTSTIDFSWDSRQNISEYRLHLGTTRGKNDIYSNHSLFSPGVQVNTIPLNGHPVYVRLWSRIDDEWTYVDYEYKTKKIPVVPAQIAGVINTSDGVERTLIVTWDQGQGTLEYRLDAGTKRGANDLFQQERGKNTYATVTNIPIGLQSVYLRLWFKTHQGWVFKDYVFEMNSETQRLVELS